MMQKNIYEDITILYVEDEEDIREELAEYLRVRFKEVYTAKDGREGLEVFQKHDPDIILTDIQMPHMNGIEMTMSIKEKCSERPVVMITAFNDMDYMIEAINAGVDKYLLKPIKISKLEEMLFNLSKELISKKELRRKSTLLNEYKNAVDEAALVTKTNTNGIVTYANKKFCEILGYTEEELLGKNHNIMRHPDVPSSVFKELWDTVSAKKVWHKIVKNRAKDGRSVWLNTTIIPILDENRDIVEYVALRQDITELEEYKNDLESKVKNEIQKREEQENILIRQSRMAEMGEMIGVIAHQWKQPLNAFSLQIQDLKYAYEAGEIDEAYINNTIDLTLKGVNFMSETVDDFRNFFKPEQNKEVFSVNKAISMVERILSPQLRSASVEYKNDIKDEITAYGYGNEFKQVFLNILNNAKDAICQKKERGCSGQIVVDAYNEEKMAVIKIKDSGGGIPEEIIERIFDSYFSTKSKEAGTGIGLYMAKTIIEKKMNGALSVNNVENGAEFTIKLPVSGENK